MPSFSHLCLIASSVFLLAVIAIQDFLVPKLRNDTISAGLNGTDHVLLDASYVPLGASLVWTMWPQGWVAATLAVIAAVALVFVAWTNTGHAWWDAKTGGKHSLWHTRFTITVFVSALALQIRGDMSRHWLIALTVSTVAAPAAAYLYFRYRPTTIDGAIVAASPAAEKLYVFFLCFWFVASVA